ncbi:GAL3ST1 [Acanthosepion pharaonis]|uniref:GAL3ST1 n=1 Tax=Acanthosepion pharaonis TaxID=158019 RepID=A0A812BED7_ACAPH|nr:GAL3ST1 [Sepia pharaonis]
MNILQRYGLARNLTFILPLEDNYLGKHTTLELSPRILVPPEKKAINILCNHVVYNRSAFHTALTGRRIVHENTENETKGSCNQNLVMSGENTKDNRCGSRIDTNRTTIDISDYTLFTMIRRPLSQVLSAVYYYKLFPKVATHDLMEAILKTPTLFTANRMSFDLGLPPSQFYSPTKVQEFITSIDADFHLVLLMEYFDESMVLLRRRLCWKTTDILYIKRNSGENRPRIRVTSEQQERFRREQAPADSALYDYFRPRFWRAIRTEGSDFFDEVHHYRSLLSLVQDYCSYIKYRQFDPDPVRGTAFTGDGLNQTRRIVDNNENPLRIAASRWHNEFSIGSEECNIMTMEELSLVDRIRQLEYGKEIQVRKKQRER